MANYRNIEIGFWTDPKIEDFSPEDKYFYLYLLTNPHTNICGCYEIGMKSMRNETGYSDDTIMKLLNRMEDTHDVIRYDSNTKEVLLLNWHKYNWSSSEKVTKAVISVANHIKSDAFKKYIISKAETRTDDRTQITDNRTQITDNRVQSTDTDVSIGYGYHMDTISDKPKTQRFTPPTLEEVQDYIEERNYRVDANKWYDYYSSIGWKVGKNPMKDWKASVRYWASKDKPKEEKGRLDWIDDI